METSESLSSAMQLLTTLWEHQQECVGRSWLRVNQSLRRGMMLAVEMGMRFGIDDFAKMRRFRPHFWWGDLEDFYRRAVCYGNATAWKAYEKFRGRKPFIWKGAEVPSHYGGGKMGTNLSRLVVGARFTWMGKRVVVTSFNDNESEPYLTACSYVWTPEKTCKKCGSPTTYPREKLVRRFKITHRDLRDAKRRLKEQRELAQLAAICRHEVGQAA